MRSRDPDEARERLSRLGVGDFHGVVALASGVVTLLTSMACCLSAQVPREPWLMIGAAALAVALWSGLFGLLTRGSPLGGVAARLGMLCLVGAFAFACLAWFRHVI